MKRITVSLPDDLSALLDQERRRRDVPAAAIIREAVERYLVSPGERRQLRIAGLGSSTHGDTAERIEEILDEEWGGAQGYRSLMFGEAAGPPVARHRPAIEQPIADEPDERPGADARRSA
jgi:predicted transcriptional regulator